MEKRFVMGRIKMKVILFAAMLCIGVNNIWSATEEKTVNSLTDLVNAIGSGSVTSDEKTNKVTLTSNVDGNNIVVIESGSYVIDLNGKTWSMTYGTSFTSWSGPGVCIKIKGGALIIKGGGVLKASAIGAIGGKNQNATTIEISEDGKLCLYSARLEASRAGTGTARLLHNTAGKKLSDCVTIVDGCFPSSSVNWENSDIGGSSFAVQLHEYPYKISTTEELTGTYTVEKYPDLSTVDVTKVGFLFKGWKDQNSKDISSFEGITGDVTLAAQWDEFRYKLSFDAKNGQTMQPLNYTYKKMNLGEVEMPSDPVRTGYSFKGWYDTFNYSTPVVTSPPVPQDQNRENAHVEMMLYAKWEPIIYKITYKPDGGQILNGFETYTIETPTFKLPIPTHSNPNYTFAGWYENDKFTGNKVTSVSVNTTGDKTFYAKWSQTYIVTCHWNIEGEKDKIYSYTKDSPIITLPTTEKKKGYNPVWYDNKELKGTPVTTVSTSNPENKEFYAKWVPISYSILFKPYNGTFPSGVVIPEKYTVESPDMVLPTPVRNGFSFAGWFTSDDLKTQISVLSKGSTGNQIFYAKWTEGNSVNYTQPMNGNITVTSNGNSNVKNGEKVGTGVPLRITVVAKSSEYTLTKLTIGKTVYTTSPIDTIMPASGGLSIAAEFADLRTAVSAPTIATDPENTDYVLGGDPVKITLGKTDAASTLYYSLNGSTPKAYTEPFQVSGFSSDTLTVTAYARKAGYKDGVTTREIAFQGNKITITFNLPTGVKAISPEGGEVVSAVASGGSFEFKLNIDKDLFATLDTMKVLANDSIIRSDGSGIYIVSGQISNVTITVEGLDGATYPVTLLQSNNGSIYFTDDESTETRTVARGDTISVTAVANEDYQFLQWEDGSQKNPRKVVVNGTRDLKATFVAMDHFTVTLPEITGVKVKPLTGYPTEVKKGGKFKCYLRLDSDYSDSNPVVMANGEVIDVNQEVYAIYNIQGNISISVSGIKRNKAKFTLAKNVMATALGNGEDIATQDLYTDDQVSVYAKAPEGQVFSKWNDGKLDNPRILSVKDAASLVPLFQIKNAESVTSLIIPAAVGAGLSVVNANADAIEKGEDVQIKLVILPQYSQSNVQVYANGKALSSSLKLRASSETTTLFYTLSKVNETIELEVKGLTLNLYSIELQQLEGGSIQADKTGTLLFGTEIQLTATPLSGNMFVKWSDGNTLNPYPYILVGDAQVSAVFKGMQTPSDTEKILSSGRVYSTNQMLHVEISQLAPLWIWNYTGRLIKSMHLMDMSSSIPLECGIYIVKVGDEPPVKIRIK